MSFSLIARSIAPLVTFVMSKILFIKCSKISAQSEIVDISCFCLDDSRSRPSHFTTSMLQMSEFKGFRNSWDIAAINVSLVRSDS